MLKIFAGIPVMLSGMFNNGLGSREEIFDALVVMAKGMIGIFIALTVVYLFTLLLTKLFPPKDDETQEMEE
jgi:hypothetical protein